MYIAAICHSFAFSIPSVVRSSESLICFANVRYVWRYVGWEMAECFQHLFILDEKFDSPWHWTSVAEKLLDAGGSREDSILVLLSV